MKKIFSSAKEVFHYVVASLDHYDPREASAISFRILEYFGISKTDVLSGRQEDFIHGEKLHEIIDRLNLWEPVQYVLEETEFLGRKFLVTPAVLIPRPETEELVKIIVDENSKVKNLKVLDIGTGSGCIAVTLAKDLPEAEVHAMDISKEALKTTEQNAKLNFTKVILHEENILNNIQNNFPEFDLIVSNPPYVMESEKKSMKKNVLDYEPHIALFVPDNDPLLFYKRILKFSEKALKKGGCCYFEINEQLGKQLKDFLENSGYTEIKIFKDFHGKDRFIKGFKTNS